MKLSILIPTHNRPLLFERCINSVLKQIANHDVEIIVNNDSQDIRPIHHGCVQYHYNQFNNLSQIYQFLLSQASGEYVYFLEDDDHVAKDFFDVNLDADLIGGNYYPCYDTKHLLAIMKQCKDREFTDFKTFANQVNFEHLQLSQYIFKKSVIQDFEFPMDNNVHNDIHLVLHAAQRSNQIRTTSKVLFYQTIDGGDNISFDGSNSQINTSKSLAFLEQYGLQKTASH